MVFDMTLLVEHPSTRGLAVVRQWLESRKSVWMPVFNLENLVILDITQQLMTEYILYLYIIVKGYYMYYKCMNK